MVKTLTKDKLAVNIYENRTLMGEAAANDIAACMEKLLAEKDTINMVFAAAPSQNDVLESLLKKPLDWNRVNAFHMDEYVGLKKEDAQSFGNYLNEHIFKKVPFANQIKAFITAENSIGMLDLKKQIETLYQQIQNWNH